MEFKLHGSGILQDIDIEHISAQWSVEFHRDCWLPPHANIMVNTFAPVVRQRIRSLFSVIRHVVWQKLNLCQIPVSAISTPVHKSKFIAEKFCSIPVEGSTLCKHHKQLYPGKWILCGILTWDQAVQSPTEIIQYDNKKHTSKWPTHLPRGTNICTVHWRSQDGLVGKWWIVSSVPEMETEVWKHSWMWTCHSLRE